MNFLIIHFHHIIQSTLRLYSHLKWPILCQVGLVNLYSLTHPSNAPVTRGVSRTGENVRLQCSVTSDFDVHVTCPDICWDDWM